MDSTVSRTTPAPVASSVPPDTLLAETTPDEAVARRRALAPLGRVLPLAHGLVRFCYRTAGVSAVAVGLILAAVLSAPAAAQASATAMGLLGMLLLVPAGAAALLGWTLSDLLRLPRQIREAAAAAAGGVRAEGVRKSRLSSLIGAVWAARGLVLTSRDGWMKAIAAARVARLASLPFALGLVGLFVLNGVVVLGGLVALAVLVF